MRFDVLTLFPQIPQAFFDSSIMAKAVQKGIISYTLVNIRDFAHDKHKTCDDIPYGGGAGMLMLAEPLALALDSVQAKEKRVLYLSPSGKKFSQKTAEQLSKEESLVLICGRYEGIDQRIIDEYVDDEVCIGDYVMSSGELAALVVIDTIYRLIDGVISGESLEEESFTDGLLEYPQYTRPRVFRNREVPAVLLSGHHANIRRWRLEKRIEKTLKNRPDLLQVLQESGTMSQEAQIILKELIK
ncbi:tRNA (guanosine(37)-N1)-methyltransferase TrmD [Treponema phagedenis]|uniref:tRNA (guanine-N(1)-)-methyltransferase n=1 Tax=Treponema phagedenis TaxID=162 RepID=A0A0B7H0H9_TREPH|nr:tRNA (guanosine(37)-N1)-methyltransferase TrmD [Treponema phagedenis]NVP23443.1 tRNA (guanosine(37)-N1)-methyltransferase TrmD [Treponema phagedenis]QEJ95659.1 tRNA (guanosine(37)-N1)-methyltransferase TrmD [Treponema phagedenis]QEJ98584.1 tRNA (guanosine(37)-N1)-methyltransferase TrmD [Treponema phagedenis]QEK01517.1 tRNA (guanosine(37)-N1)-methyltransferase TrmD [Treponema phagedenis]QEK04089.1 tRNA (guanosine(37)-N1)-methyltransferase TrmD [Treponema phagedenis]